MEPMWGEKATKVGFESQRKHKNKKKVTDKGTNYRSQIFIQVLIHYLDELGANHIHYYHIY